MGLTMKERQSVTRETAARYAAASRNEKTMILNEFKKAFDGLGVKEINAVGKEFDPKFHEAMKTENSDDVPEGTVIAQWKAGYIIGERLIRPATVVVSAGPAKKEDEKAGASRLKL